MKIPLNLNDVQESRPVPAGRYNLVVATAEEAVSQKGAPQIKVSIGIEGHETAPNVSHYISLPGDGDEPSKATFKALLLKRFLVAFKIPFGPDGFDVQDFPGASCSADLTLSEPDDSGNIYNRLQLPRLASEGDAPAGKGSAKPPKR